MNTIEKKTPKAAQASKSATLTIAITPGAMRLARQLHEDPEVMIHRLIRLGIRNVDFALANDCTPFAWDDTDDFDVTAAMDGLTHRQISDLEQYSDKAQRVLYIRELERRGFTYQGEPLNQPQAIFDAWVAQVEAS